ncbi:MAG: ABC transporter ATP-binding protein [Sulfuricella sp.]|nr:ABC transporter ATP-binding protein [Sulfuricella sp.]
MADNIAISVQNLTKKYRIFGHPGDRIKQALAFGRVRFHREFTALQDVSFEIKKGETVGIIGRNGSGKSTLLQLICGILKPTTGTVQVNGRISALLELGAGFNPEFTGRENVYFQGALMGLSKEEMAARFPDIASFADIGEFIDQPVRTYSSGMFVRLAFSVMANIDAEVLIIDEALSVGDAAFTQKCMRFLVNFRQHGTVIFVSHDLASIAAFCDRAVWLDKGKLHAIGSAKEACEAYLSSMLGVPHREKVVAPIITECLADQRQQLMNCSILRNDLEVFCFDPTVDAAGSGRAQITDVYLANDEGERYGWVVGGELATLTICAKVFENLASPILGFVVKNRLGQALFGDNTYLSYADAPLTIEKEGLMEARFRFRMPRLPVGGYTITAAIATGTQTQWVTHYLLHEALAFESHSSSIGQSLMGLPMLDITLTAHCKNETAY